MRFGRITTDTEKFSSQPHFEGTGVLVADVLELLALEDDDAVIEKYPSIDDDDINDALLFAAEAVRSTTYLSSRKVPRKLTSDDEYNFHIAARLALEHPRPKKSLEEIVYWEEFGRKERY